MSEPILMEDRGDGFPLFYDPATFENFYVAANGGRRIRFNPDAPPKYAVTAKLIARSNVSPPRGTRTSLSPDGNTLRIFGPMGDRSEVGVDDAVSFREVCNRLHGRI